MTALKHLPALAAASLCLATLLAASPQAALAANPERAARAAAELKKRFAAADTNGDGRLTREEAKDKMPMVYSHFDEIDTAHTGSVSLADIVAYARTQQASRKEAP
jgi:Ca2+-binding EF-hand superfamily protein